MTVAPREPRTDVDGRFDRAERLARSRGSKEELLRIVYNRAWTAYWWYEDVDELDRLYDEAESLAIDSTVWDLEKLVNLWLIGVASIRNNRDSISESNWVIRGKKLKSVLNTRAKDLDKPTSALWAETQMCLMDITLAIVNGQFSNKVLCNLKAIIEAAQNHLDYPFEAVFQIVMELGEYIGEREGYDELFETVMELQSTRASRGEKGRVRLRRGSQPVMG